MPKASQPASKAAAGSARWYGRCCAIRLIAALLLSVRRAVPAACVSREHCGGAQLRERMPPLRQREQTLRAELQAIADQTNDQATFLRLAETLAAFLSRLRSTADTLDITERQRIVRLVVKEALIGDDNIVIRHSIPIALTPPASGGPPAPSWPAGAPTDQSYLLRKGRNYATLRRTGFRVLNRPVLHYARLQ